MYKRLIIIIYLAFNLFHFAIGQHATDAYKIGDTFLYSIDENPYSKANFEKFGDYYSLSFLSSPYSKFVQIENPTNPALKEISSISLEITNDRKLYLSKNNSGYYTRGEEIKTPISNKGKVLKIVKGEKPFLPSNKLSKNINKSYIEEIKIAEASGLFASLLPPNVDSVMIKVNGKVHIKEIEDCKIQIGAKIINGTKWTLNHTILSSLFYKSKRESKWNQISKELAPTILDTAPITDYSDYEILMFVDDNGKMISRSKIINNVVHDTWYTVDEKTEDLKVIDDKTKDVILYPNPTYGNIKIELINYPPDYYQLEIYNIIGKVVYRKSNFDYKINTIRDDVSFLKKGSYLYSILDRNGKKLITKRLVIITP
jgi:hypothetical protein